MALIFGNETDNVEKPKPTDEPGGVNIFQHVPEGLGQQAQDVVGGMLAGTSTAAAQATQREALARAAQQYRAQAGEQAAPFLGQGTAIRTAQAAERDIFGEVAKQGLAFAEMDQEAKERGVGMLMQMEQLGDTKFNQRWAATQMLIDQGGAANYAEAAEEMAALFPGMEVDFSRAITAESAQDYRTGMSLMADMISSGISLQDALPSILSQNIPTMLGLDETQITDMYLTMERATNPMLAMIDSINAVPDSEMSREMKDAAIMQYQADLTGFEIWTDPATGKVTLQPPDGYTTISSLTNVAPGDSVKFSRTLYNATGSPIPPGRYSVIEVSKDKDDTDVWSGDVTHTTTTTIFLVNNATGQRYWHSKSATSDTEDYHGLVNFLMPESIF